MEKFHEVRLTNICDDDLVIIFQDHFSETNTISSCYVRFKNHYGYFPVKSMKYDKFLEGWEIFNNAGDKIGQINHTVFSSSIVLTFEIVGDKYAIQTQTLIDELQRELKFIGIKIENARHFSKGLPIDSQGKVVKAPSTKTTLSEHRTAYKIIKNMKNEENEKFYNSDSDVIENPTKAELCARVNREMNRNYSEKTISRIIKEGDNGLLE